MNRNIQARGKRPRERSDDYAAKIEKGLGLGEGWMDRRHRSDGSDVSEGDLVMDAEDAPLEAHAAFKQWARAVAAGRMTWERFQSLTNAVLAVDGDAE